MDVIGGKYEIIEKAGEGGSACVYKAWNRALGIYVAVKVYEDHRKLQIREKELLKELRHLAFPVIIDCIEENASVYLVMEYIEGINLEEYIKRNGPVDWRQAVKWAAELAEALSFLHNRREPIIYQDMKPANVMINEEGEIKLVDFGSVFFKHRENRKEYIHAGTYGYAAPEQFGQRAWERVDERSDIYGLGATLHYMLTGKDPALPPFILRPVRSYNAALPKALEKIVDKSVMPEKEKRFRSAREISEALQRTITKEQWMRKLYGGGRFLYNLAFLTLGTVLLTQYGGDDAENNKRILAIAALFLLFGAAGRLLAVRTAKKARRIKTVKSVYLSAKKGKGLPMAVICGVLTGVFLSMSGVEAARDTVLPVIVKNGEGRKLLIRFDAQYCPEGAMRLEIPADIFRQGEEYILRLECTNRRTKEKKSRTFYLQGPES